MRSGGVDWTRPAYRLVVAREDGVQDLPPCDVCGRAIHSGDLIRRGPRRAKAIHGECTPRTPEEVAASRLESGEAARDLACILYQNWRGETAWRVIRPLRVEFGTALPWHPDPTWLLQAVDVGIGVERSFAMHRVREWRPWRWR